MEEDKKRNGSKGGKEGGSRSQEKQEEANGLLKCWLGARQRLASAQPGSGRLRDYCCGGKRRCKV